VQALITDMSQPLGNAVGNALEVMEATETLKGRGSGDLVEICRELTAQMFLLGRLDNSLEAARARFDSVLGSGRALQKFAQVITEQGGDPRVVGDYSLLPTAEYEDSVVASEDGYVAELEAETLGRVALALGAGRERLDSVIDPAVGLVLERKVGDQVSVGDRICVIHGNDRARLPHVREMIRAAITISPEPVAAKPLILAWVPEQG